MTCPGPRHFQTARSSGQRAGRRPWVAVSRRAASRVAACGVSRRGVRRLASIKEKLTWFDLPGDQLVLDRRGPGIAARVELGGDVCGWDPLFRGADRQTE